MSKGTIKIKCPTCDRRLKVPRKSLHKSIVCPKCNSSFRVDDQSNTLKLDGTNELFGPPVSDDFSSGQFDDIDSIVEQISRNAKKSEPKEPPTEAAEPTPNLRPKRGPTTVRELEAQTAKPKPDPSEKLVKTKQEKSLGNNGIGLLILAVGVGLIPFAAGSVIPLRGMLWMMPMVAVGLAFVACFMLAYSKRRESIASLILACMPLLFISILGFASHYYTRHMLPELEAIAPPAIVELEEEEALAQPVVIEEKAEPEIDPKDRLTIDPESITNNAASRFVPARSNTSSFTKPEIDKEPTANTSVTDDNVVDSTIANDSTSRANNNEGPIAKELRNALLVSTNDEKYDSLQARLQNELLRGVVSKGKIQRPNDLQKYRLSEIAGRSTVFGMAHYSRQPVVGIDFAERKNAVDGLIDMVAPIVDFGHFKDSIVAKNESRLVGLNVFAVEEGIRGVQAVFSNGQQKVTSDWAGVEPSRQSDITTLSVAAETVHGIVVYRDKLAAVGIQLVTRPRPKK